MTDTISPIIRQQALATSGDRCEWFSLSGYRCQNVMSLKVHHRTYERYGNEEIEDVSVFCPVHHLIADASRKRAIGQRLDIIQERMVDILIGKFKNFQNEQQVEKFCRRLKTELELSIKEALEVVDAQRYILPLMTAMVKNKDEKYIAIAESDSTKVHKAAVVIYRYLLREDLIVKNSKARVAPLELCVIWESCVFSEYTSLESYL